MGVKCPRQGPAHGHSLGVRSFLHTCGPLALGTGGKGDTRVMREHQKDLCPYTPILMLVGSGGVSGQPGPSGEQCPPHPQVKFHPGSLAAFEAKFPGVGAGPDCLSSSAPCTVAAWPPLHLITTPHICPLQ